MIVTVFTAGCGTQADTEPKYYARELEQMRREELRLAAQKAEETYLKDTYPWRGKTKDSRPLTQRITDKERELTTEIKLLHDTVHKKKQTHLRLRD